MISALFTHNGVTDTLSGWSRRTGIKRATLEARMSRKSMSLAEAIETPVMKARGIQVANPNKLKPLAKPKLIRGPKHWYDYGDLEDEAVS